MQCPSPISIRDPAGSHPSKRIQVPCGKCGACLHNRRSSWTFRLKQEERKALTAFFITLTYRDDELPHNRYGEISLEKTDLQKFLKRLRKENAIHCKWKIRYYAVGEYGSKTERPHYHLIIFNVHDNTIKKLSKIWMFGHSHHAHVNDATIHYVTKYHVNRNYDKNKTRQPEFATMSRNPGLGKNYLEKNYEWHKENKYNHVINNGYKQQIPRYYKDRIFTEIEKKEQSLKEQKRQRGKFRRQAERLERSGKDSPESYIHQSKVNEAKKVKRKLNDNDLF